MRLKEKVAIVTGGGSGIGETAAILFAREGAKVVIADIRGEAAEATVRTILEAGGNAQAVRADVTRAKDVKATVQKAVDSYGKLNIVLNNAGIAAQGGVTELTEEDWDRVMEVNLKATFLGCKYAIPEMVKSGGGSIINMSSITAVVGGASISCVYPASKAGLLALSKDTAMRYAHDHIRVNCVISGHIETPLTSKFLQAEAKQNLVKKYPLGRLGTPMEVAYAVLFLASDESSFITGAELLVDGGYTAQ